jgi:hypothetical protein
MHNQVGLDLASVELEGIHRKLVRAIESPFLSALRAVSIDKKSMQSIERRLFKRLRPSVGIKYQCTDEEVEGVVLKLEEELKSGTGTLKVIGLALTQYLSKKKFSKFRAPSRKC